ncbi:MAG: carbonic anhydrase [Thermoanaerobaculia bacterium]|jgi:carbonic anhydrase|nr:carbonic anhydrase [Thermoanaerobaculia bacterium]
MRRSINFLLSLLVAISVALPAAAQFPAPFQPPYNVESLWPQLMAGNDLFARGALPYTQLDDVRKATQSEQNPPVAVLSCSDSRVPPEIVFGRGLGELFVVRAAGNVADTFGIASLEYSVAHHWTKVIVVLAHDRCGAVTEALKKTDPPTPSLLALVTRIRKSFTGVTLGKKRDDVHAAVVANAKASADYLVAHSKVIRDAVRKHEVEIVVAYYGFGEGKVEKIR